METSFSILAMGIKIHLKKTQALIVVTAILHIYIAIMKKYVLPDLFADLEEALNYVNNVTD